MTRNGDLRPVNIDDYQDRYSDYWYNWYCGDRSRFDREVIPVLEHNHQLWKQYVNIRIDEDQWKAGYKPIHSMGLPGNKDPSGRRADFIAKYVHGDGAAKH